MDKFHYITEVGKNTSLLVIDDDKMTLAIFEKLFIPYFKEIKCVSSAEYALEIYKLKQYDIVICDLYMPKMDGLQFFLKIKSINESQAFIMMSSVYSINALTQIINYGVDGFLPKPFNQIEIKKELNRILSRLGDHMMLKKYYDDLENENELLRAKLVALSATTKLQTTESSSNSIEIEDFEIILPEKRLAQTVSFDVDFANYYSAIIGDDKDELNDILIALDSALVLAYQHSKVSSRYLLNFADSLTKFGNILLHYWLFSDIATSTLELGNAMQHNIDRIVENYEDLSVFFSAYASVLNKFVQLVWIEEAPNPLIFSESIQNDTGMILTLINPPKNERDDELVFF